MIHREGRYSPSEWDWAPVVDYKFIPPSPLLNLFVGVAVYFEPQILVKIKYISYSLFRYESLSVSMPNLRFMLIRFSL